jgi:hypothetical protein
MIAIAKSAHQVEYKNWLKSIDVYKSELSKMQKQLEELTSGYYNRNIAIQVERFQNRFIRQKEVIDTLRHNVKAHENDLELLEEKDNDMLRNKVKTERWKLRDEVRVFKDLFVELEQDFNDFLA